MIDRLVAALEGAGAEHVAWRIPVRPMPVARLAAELGPLRLSRRGRTRYLPDAQVEHRKERFGTRDPRAFNRMVVVNRTYLFRKNFPQTRLARAQFRLFLLLLFGHRLLNRDWARARGLIDGVRAARSP